MNTIKQTSAVTSWYPKSAYLQYLSSQSPAPLSPTAQLQITYDDEDPSQGISFQALDFETQQLITVDPEGLVERYTISKVA